MFRRKEPKITAADVAHALWMLAWSSGGHEDIASVSTIPGSPERFSVETRDGGRFVVTVEELNL